MDLTTLLNKTAQSTIARHICMSLFSFFLIFQKTDALNKMAQCTIARYICLSLFSFFFSDSQPFTITLNSNNYNEIICLFTLTILSMLTMVLLLYYCCLLCWNLLLSKAP